MAKVYEKKGGDYEESGDNANQAKKGAPKPKKEAVEKGERKDPSEPVGTPKTKKADTGDKRKADTDSAEPKKAPAKKAKTNGTKDKKPATPATRSQPKRGSKK